MSLTKRVGLVAGAAALSLTGASFAGTGADNDGMQQRLQQLEAKLAEMESRQGNNWLTEQRSAEIRSLVQDVLADADTRASLLGAGGVGYNNGFQYSSQDGNITMKLNGLMQTRFIFSRNDDDGGVDSTRYGFENARTKLIASGNVYDFMYKIEGNFSRGEGGGFGLQDAWIGWNYDNGWSVYMGQFKAPVVREGLVADEHLLAVDRSIFGSWYSGRTQGIKVKYTGDQFRFAASFNDGFNDANGAWETEDTEWSFSGRAEILFDGSWDQFDDFTSFQGSGNGVMLGLGAHYESQEYGTAAANEMKFLALTADISFEFDGANIFASFTYEDWDDDNGTDWNPWFAVIQGGYFFTADLEGFARFEHGDLDNAGDDYSIVTVGVNKYFHGHNAKWTTDFSYNFDEVPGFGDGITGWRASGGEDGQWVIRTQLQLLF